MVRFYFVSTKKQASEAIAEVAKETDQVLCEL